ncbi:MAG: beta-lactamase family protein [Ruminococcus sp.]|nr:beta-lactamase family protein [Ruminococcus sp.]
MEVMEKISIERAETAESVGVSSKEVQAFIDHCMEENKELHSVMVIRHGKVACEAYRDPYGPEHKHMMYSVSKSFTSTAIGFAIDEGLIALDTKLVDVFPEARGDKPDAYLEKMTVEDLLTMRSGLSVSPFMDKTKDRWFKDILASEWISEPGTEFLYISENMYLLCCIIHKVTGMSVMDYLTPRLFEPLGIENAYWETCPRGIEAGGWGMMLSTEDLAKFTLCYQQGGKFNGKQVIPEWYTKQATVFHSDNSVANQDLDSVKGYGYCFWRNGGYENSYRADGMFSQFGIVFEDLDACFISTGGEINEQGMRDMVWAHFPKAFIDDDANAETTEIAIPAYDKLPAKPHSFLEKKIANRTIKFMKPLTLNAIGFPVSVLTLPAVFMERDKAGNISNVTFKFMENELIFTWTEGDEVNSIYVGMDGEYRWDDIVLGEIPYHTCAIGAWNTENELEIRIRAIETVAERVLTFKFNGDNVTMQPASHPTVGVMAETLKDTVKDVIKQPVIQSAVSGMLPHIVPLVDFKHFGKIK